MNNYMSFFREFDGMARANFEVIKKAEQKLNRAKEQADLYHNVSSYDSEVRAKDLRAQADLEEAKKAYEEALKSFKATTSNAKDIRARLEASLEEEYRIRPTQVDAVTLELMKSGIMKSADYRHLLEEAKKDGNHTMTRLIGKYANDASDARTKTHGATDPEATALRLLANEGNTDNGKEYLDSFDSMDRIYHKCTENPFMIDHWDEFINLD
jgi:tetratricopeptide (TPR) repeat protein